MICGHPLFMLFQMKLYAEKLLLPLGKRLIHIPANYFTIISCLMSFLAGLGFYAHLPWLLIPSLLLIEVFDQLDGVVARLQGPTAFGAYLDSTLDRYGDFAIFIGIWFGEYTNEWVVIGALVGTLMTSYARARAEALGIDSLGGIGILERTDRIPLLLLGAIVYLWYGQAFVIIMWILLIGTNFTAFQRTLYVYRQLR